VWTGLQKKRKWLAAQDADSERGDESSRATKNPRISAATPHRTAAVPGYLSPTKSRLLKTPGTARQTYRPPLRGASPSIRNGRVASNLARPSSSSKVSATPQNSRRPPSSATFNPAISNGVPPYPKHDANSGGAQLGLRRVNSITIRRQPSSADFHSRSDPPAVRTPPRGQHSRLEHPEPTHPLGPTPTGSLPARQPPSAQVHVTVPTVDGFFLEFNPLLVSPGTLNDLQGITEDAKKQAREEMVRLVKEAVSKWTI